MSDFFEIDSVTGIRSDFTWDESEQRFSIVRSADVEPVLNVAAANRNELGLNRQGIKESWWCYATIPPIVQLQMRAKGIIVGNKDHEKRIIEEINTHYPHLKMTTGKMGGKQKLISVG